MAERDPELKAGGNYPAYDADFAAWLDAQVSLLRERRFDELDLPNLIEEVEDVGKSEFRAFVSAIELILLHMLKWDYQPERQSRSWRNTIHAQRRAVHDILVDNPSYKARIAEAVRRAYNPVPFIVERETTVPASRLPEQCPYGWDEVLHRLHEFDADRDGLE